MGQQVLNMPDDLRIVRDQWLWDEFFTYTTGGVWTSLIGGTATVGLGAGPPSQVALNTLAVLGQEAGIFATNKFWQFGANKRLRFTTRINAQEANVNNLSIFAGFTSMNTTGLVTSTNPNALNGNFTGAGFFLPSGSTNWSCALSIGTTQQIIPSVEAAVPAGDQELSVDIQIVGAGLEVSYWAGTAEPAGGADSVAPIKAQLCRDTSGRPSSWIKNRLPYAGALAMTGGVYIRNCSATAETARVDYVGLQTLR